MKYLPLVFLIPLIAMFAVRYMVKRNGKKRIERFRRECEEYLKNKQ